MSYWGYRAFSGDKHRLPSMDYNYNPMDNYSHPYAYQGSRSARHYGVTPGADEWFDGRSAAAQDGKRATQLFHVSNFPPLFVNADQQNTERTSNRGRGQRRQAQYYGNRNMQLSDPNFLPASPYGANRPVSAVRQSDCCPPAGGNPNQNPSASQAQSRNNQSACCVPPPRNYNPNYSGLQNVPNSRPLARNACDCSQKPPPLDFNRPVVERETYVESRNPAFMPPSSSRPMHMHGGSDSAMTQELYDYERAMNQRDYELAFGKLPRSNYASPRAAQRLNDYYALSYAY